MMTVLTVFSLVGKRPLEKKRTGSKPFPVRVGSLTFVCTCLLAELFLLLNLETG